MCVGVVALTYCLLTHVVGILDMNPKINIPPSILLSVFRMGFFTLRLLWVNVIYFSTRLGLFDVIYTMTFVMLFFFLFFCLTIFYNDYSKEYVYLFCLVLSHLFLIMPSTKRLTTGFITYNQWLMLLFCTVF